MTKGSAARAAYARSGVDVVAGDRAVTEMAPAVESTRRPEVIGGLGGFGGAFTIPAGYREPVLVASTDGVGTKTAIATAMGRWDTIGIDLVAMCADDVVCSGAEPIAFLDYVAVGRLDPSVIGSLVGGVAAGCRAAGCALVGGETAEHPGLMEPGAFDLAGTCVGVVERADLLDGTAARPGDTIVGLAASGLHSNGYSLVRQLVARADLDLTIPYAEVLARFGISGATAAGGTLGDRLLAPTRIYAPTILAIRDELRAAGLDVRGAAHITGGGLPGNVPRMLPDDLGARIHTGSWSMPRVMRLLAAVGELDDAEIRATFNGGIGMVMAVEPGGVAAVVELASGRGIRATAIGEVVEASAIGGRYLEVVR